MGQGLRRGTGLWRGWTQGRDSEEHGSKGKPLGLTAVRAAAVSVLCRPLPCNLLWVRSAGAMGTSFLSRIFTSPHGPWHPGPQAISSGYVSQGGCAFSVHMPGLCRGSSAGCSFQGVAQGHSFDLGVSLYTKTGARGGKSRLSCRLWACECWAAEQRAGFCLP